MGGISTHDAGGGQLEQAFAAEERAGLRLAAVGRAAALAVIAIWLPIAVPTPAVYYIEAVVLAIAASGLANWRLATRYPRQRWLGYAFAALDATLTAAGLVLVPAAVIGDWPAQMTLRNGTFDYYFVYLALVALSYAPRLMLWAGACSALAWVLAVQCALAQPGTPLDQPAEMWSQAHLALALDPFFIDVNQHIQDVIVVVLVAAVLAAVVARSRRLVFREARAARERSNLARYFSPNLVDELALRDQPLGPGRRQDVAVLFTDIVGFTAMAERMAPEQVLNLLRGFHGRMEAAVFDHGGTLEKFIGDAMLATFGVPAPGPADAGAALATAREMLARLSEWNDERRAAGQDALEVGIGLHYGPAVLGDIGSERNMAFAVVGDTTNTASRLQGLTRELGCAVVASEAFRERVRAEAGGAGEALLAGFRREDGVRLRGRAGALTVWTLPAPGARP